MTKSSIRLLGDSFCVCCMAIALQRHNPSGSTSIACVNGVVESSSILLEIFRN